MQSFYLAALFLNKQIKSNEREDYFYEDNGNEQKPGNRYERAENFAQTDGISEKGGHHQKRETEQTYDQKGVISYDE